MLYKKLLSLKENYNEFDKKKFKTFIDIINSSNIKFKVIVPNKVNLKLKKNNFNIILNKITIENYQEILIDEINKKNINLNNINNLIEMIINKVLDDGKFVDCNVIFLIDLIKILNKDSEKNNPNQLTDKIENLHPSTSQFKCHIENKDEFVKN